MYIKAKELQALNLISQHGYAGCFVLIKEQLFSFYQSPLYKIFM
jgi:hypothetical protein